MKNLYLLVIGLTISTFLHGQVLRGKIADKNTGAPLAGVNIQYGGNGTVTDRDGNFSISCAGTTDVVVSHVGFETVRQAVQDCNTELNILLTPSTQVLSEVEITTTSALNRSMLSQPASITKLGSAEIKRGMGLFLDDAINANIPGVFMQRRTISAGQQFNIRGYGGGGPGVRGINSNFDQQGVKAYLNGIPVTDAEGITLMDDIDFGSVGNVEIIKGPSGSLYGLAIAGVINLQTIRPEKGKVSIGQDVLFGSYGLRRYTTHFESSTENNSILLNYGRQTYDGFMPHTNSEKDFVNVMGDFRLNEKQSLTTYFGYSNSYDARNGELTIDQYKNHDYSGNQAYIKNNAHSNIISFRAGIGHTYRFTQNISNTTSVFGTGLSNNNSSAGGWTDKTPVNFGLRSVFDTKFSLGSDFKLSGVTGVEAQKQYAQTIAYPMVVNNADPDGYNIIGTIRSNQTSISGTYSIFTEWTLTMPYNLSFTAGVGSSSMSIELRDKLYVAANNNAGNTVPSVYKTSYDHLVSPHVALNKVINNQLSVYASYSQGYRAPVASNIYTPLAGKANTGLKPEVGKQFEIGGKGSVMNDKLIYEVAVFQANFSDKMTTVAVPNADNTATLYTYVINGGKLNNKGVEALVKYTIFSSENGFVKFVRPFVNYTYSDFKYKRFTYQNNATQTPSDYSGKDVAGVPPTTLNAGIDFASNMGWYANVTYQYRDAMPITPDNATKTDSYALLNAKVGFRKTFGHLTGDLYFGANNITGEQYYQMVFINQLPDAYIPGPDEINYFGGLNLRYNF
jgi:iron complex outermembrane receptor protein